VVIAKPSQLEGEGLRQDSNGCHSCEGGNSSFHRAMPAESRNRG